MAPLRLRWRWRIPLLVLLCLTVLLPSWAGSERSPFLFLTELRPGMVGTGKTVVHGDRIEDFSVRIIDVIDNPGELEDQIVVRVSGPAIAAAGGVAAGMSGSPIYVNGRLIGALWGAAEFDKSPEPLALVRPIATMLALLEPLQAQSAGAEVDQFQEESTLPGFQPLATPVWVSGLGGRGLARLRDGVPLEAIQKEQAALLPLSLPLGEGFLQELTVGLAERYNLVFLDTGLSLTSPADEGEGAALEPGSAIGVLLATGDVKIGALGTVTYREGDLILGFGHHFLLRGPGEFFLTGARIIDTVQSLQMPFKLGVPTATLGTVLQDRFQGIAASLGRELEGVEVRVLVRDRRGHPTGMEEHNREFTIRLVADPDLFPVLLYAVVLDSIDKTLNRIGPGTLRVRYTFRGRGLPRELQREDIFYSFSDIAVTAPLQIAQVAYLLAWNEFQDPGLTEVEVEMEITPEVRAYELLELSTDKESYKPGEEINYTVVLKSFRGPEEEFHGTLPLPADLEETMLTVHAFGGPRQDGEGGGEESPKFASLEELLTAIEELESNDQLTVELLGLPAQTDSEELKAEVKRFPDWVVVGEEFVDVRVAPPQTPSVEVDQGEEQEEQKQEQKQKQECKQLFYCE